ncbi:MAG: hypothetical protein AAGD33_07860 [Actinomycetota bacterium]
MRLALVDDHDPSSSRSVEPAREYAARDTEVSSRAPVRSDDLAEVLAELGDRISTGSLATERVLPVAEPLSDLFPDGGLVRGRVVACRSGGGAAILPLLVASRAVADGAWLAVVDVDTIGLDAADELGLPIERIVRVSTASTPTWIDVMGAAVDGFDLVVTRVPEELRGTDRVARHGAAMVRKLMSRLQQKGSVVVVLGDPGVVPCDLELGIERSVWSGLGQGWGHLRHRSLELVSTGRRVTRPRTCSVEIDVELRGGVESVRLVAARRDEMVDRNDGDVFDPDEVVVEEMRASLERAETTESDADGRSDHVDRIEQAG